jgi:hypothetical protein
VMAEFDDLVDLGTLMDGDSFMPSNSWADLGYPIWIDWNLFVNVPIESPNY